MVALNRTAEAELWLRANLGDRTRGNSRPSSAGRNAFVNGLFLLVLLLARVVPASQPAPRFELVEGYDFHAPDGSWRIEQYVNRHESDDSGLMWEWEVWCFPAGDSEGFCLTQPNDHRHYGSSFELSNDGRWLLRSQKIHSGTHTVYLYERDENTIFRRVTHRGLGDLAWSFFRMQPEISFDKSPTFHEAVGFAEWRQSRYLILSLSADAVYDRGTERNFLLDEWRCAFDLRERKFKLLPGMAESNASNPQAEVVQSP